MSEICDRLHHEARKLPRLKTGFGVSDILPNGIYFLFEKGEQAHGGERIVRVGTHTGDGNLPKRLAEHFYAKNKDRSIFRKHIGRCLLRRDNHPYVDRWEYDLTKKADRAKYEAVIDHDVQAAIENEVTRYMTENFSFSVVEIDLKADRIRFEERIIGTLSKCEECAASSGWLGKWHSNSVLGSKGLWNVQGHHGEVLSGENIQSLFGR